MKSRWQLQEAKSKLSQVVQLAQAGTPQFITLRGKPAVVVLSSEAFQNLCSRQTSLIDSLKDPILENDDLFQRSRETAREIKL